MKCLLLLLSTFGSTNKIQEQKNTNRGPTPDYVDDKVTTTLIDKVSAKALPRVEDRGPRPDDYEEDNPASREQDNNGASLRSISLRDAHTSPKRRLKDFANKCKNGEVENGTKSPWTNQKHKCNLEGRKGFRLSCDNGKPHKEILESELCEPGQHMFSAELEHSTKMFGYGTLFILDHGKRPFMDRSALGTVCMGRGWVT